MAARATATSASLESQPKLTRSAQAASASLTPIARRTCDGFTLPDEQAEPELTITPSRSSAITAVSAATASDNLIDSLSVATAGVFDNQTDKGSNGASRRRLGAGEWVTASVALGASEGLEGFAYIHYVPVGV